MPGRERLLDIVNQSVDEARGMAQEIRNASQNAGPSSEAAVDGFAERAHGAIDRAADAARILAKEASPPCS